MKYFSKLAMVAAMTFAVSTATVADRCITQGDHLNATHSLHAESLDPYSHLLPKDLTPGDSDSLGLTYDLKLKPLVVNDLTRLQFTTHNSSSPAAGYTSPYLWDVGQGPGHRSRYNSPFGPSPGFAPYPMPMPVRR